MFSNMSSALLAFATFVSIFAPWSAANQDLPYESLSYKGIAGLDLTQSRSFSIPDGQCSGAIGETLLCGAGRASGGVRVLVRDAVAFPAVTVDRFLRRVLIVRAQDARGRCAGAADVDVAVACLPPLPRPRAAAAAFAPDAPVERRRRSLLAF